MVLKYLIEQGADVNIRHNYYRKTALHVAVESEDNLEMIRYLIDHGADVNAKDKYDETPLEIMKRNGNINEVESVVKRSELNIELVNAARSNDFGKVQKLINQGANVNARNSERQTPLHYAVLMGNMVMVKYLIDNGANINVRNTDGETLLHYAASNDYLEIAKYLVEEKGVDVNAKKNYGWTPLHFAALGDKLEMVKYLIKQGADVSARNASGKSTLDILEERGHKEIIEKLGLRLIREVTEGFDQLKKEHKNGGYQRILDSSSERDKREEGFIDQLKKKAIDIVYVFVRFGNRVVYGLFKPFSKGIVSRSSERYLEISKVDEIPNNSLPSGKVEYCVGRGIDLNENLILADLIVIPIPITRETDGK